MNKNKIELINISINTHKKCQSLASGVHSSCCRGIQKHYKEEEQKIKKREQATVKSENEYRGSSISTEM